MLEAIQKSYFSDHFRIEKDGEEVCEIHISNWSEKADIRINGKETWFYREHYFSGDFLLEFEGKILARAKGSQLFNCR